jgi:6-phosphogluconolactonase
MSERLILPDATAVAQAAVDRFVALARSAIAANGQFTVALSGGSTPKAMFARLIDQPVDWAHVHVFWGDERCVSPEDADSNYRMACEALLNHVPIPDDNVHRMQGEINPTQAASNYTAELRAMFGRVEWPRFDLILLGLGTDAHTASLFPGTGAIHEEQRWVVGHFVEKLKTYRLTLTPPVINHAENVIFLVAGADKADALQSVLSPALLDPDRFPAQIVQPVAGTLTWLIDQAAAAELITS